MQELYVKALLFGIIPFLNLIFWYKYSQNQATALHQLQCQRGALLLRSIVEEESRFDEESPLGRCPPTQDIVTAKVTRKPPQCGELQVNADLQMYGVPTEKVITYKENNLARIKYPPYDSMVLNPHPQWGCSSFVNPHVSQKQNCFAAVFTDSPFAYNGLRFNQVSSLLSVRNSIMCLV